MPKEKNDWVKFTLRLKPETVYLMHKYCKAPTPILREVVEAWVRALVKQNLEKENQTKSAGENIKW